MSLPPAEEERRWRLTGNPRASRREMAAYQMQQDKEVKEETERGNRR